MLSVTGVLGNSLVLTTEGLVAASTLEGKQFTAIVNGKEYKSTKDGFVKTIDTSGVFLNLNNGISLKVVGGKNNPVKNKDKISLSDNKGYKNQEMVDVLRKCFSLAEFDEHANGRLTLYCCANNRLMCNLLKSVITDSYMVEDDCYIYVIVFFYYWI